LHRAAAGRVILAFPQRIAAPRARDDEKRRNRAPAPPARFGRGVPFRGPLDFDREIDDRGGRAFSDHVETPRFRKAVIRRPAGQLDGFEETLRAGRLGLEQIDRTARSDQLRKVGEAFWTVTHRIPSNTLPTRRQPAILAAEVRAKTVRRGMDYWLAAHSTGQDEHGIDIVAGARAVGLRPPALSPSTAATSSSSRRTQSRLVSTRSARLPRSAGPARARGRRQLRALNCRSKKARALLRRNGK